MVIRVTEEVFKDRTKEEDMVNFDFKLANGTDNFGILKNVLLSSNLNSPSLVIKDNISIKSNELEVEDPATTITTSDDDLTILLNIKNRLEKHGVLKELTSENRVVDFIIESESDLMGGQPWSYFLGSCGIKSKQIRYVIKKKTNQKSTPADNEDLNILVLVSKANIGSDGYTIGKIFDHFPKEVGFITNSAIKDIKQPLSKPTVYTVAKFINKDSISRVHFEEYNFIHILMHGHDGELGFESNEDENIFDWVKKEQTLPFLKKSTKKYKLIFLSLCDGAKSLANEHSLAFNLIKEDIAENVIGFNGRIESKDAAPMFCNFFYSAFLDCRDTLKAFSIAVERFIAEDNSYWFRPVLYTEKYE